MLNSFFEVGVRYDKTMDNGQVKKVTEEYLVEALTFSEAESRITDEMKSYISGEFRVVTMRMLNVVEVVDCQDPMADKFYKMKHSLITIDEKTANEKRHTQVLLFRAASVEDARQRYERYIGGTMLDTVLKQVSETNILDFFKLNIES